MSLAKECAEAARIREASREATQKALNVSAARSSAEAPPKQDEPSRKTPPPCFTQSRHSKRLT